MTTDAGRFEGTVFLDRDGTINRKAPDHDYVKTVDEFVLLPTVVEAIRALNEARRRVIVTTNQRGVALGRMSEGDLQRIHEHMVDRLAAEGASVDAIYYCPHHRDACDCRKPGVGMFLRAADEHQDVRLDECAIFGDSEADMAAGSALGMVRVLVGDGGRDVSTGDGRPADHWAPTLLDGVRWFLESGTKA